LALCLTHRIAMTENMGAPITCINFASPMVGNHSFEVSFKYLQRRGRIRCLRVTNDFDIFTQLPDRASYLYLIPCCWGPQLFTSYIFLSFLFFVFCQNRVYRHVGINLRLYSTPGRYKLSHPRASARPILCRLFNDWTKHLQRTCQRAMSLPFACLCDCCYFKVNFNTNHSILEHMKRLRECSGELQHHYLNDLYAEKRQELV
jgi:Lipase (class 3)